MLSFAGPAAADISIMRSTIFPLLQENEQIMCDKGYRQEEKCWCPPSGKIGSMSEEDKFKRRLVTHIRQLNERIIGRLTSWGIFKRKWNKGFRLHKICAHVAAD